MGSQQLGGVAIGGEHILLRYVVSSTNHGGGVTSGSWNTRLLNEETIDTGNNCALASNQFTLQPGVYRFRFDAPAYKVDSHQSRLYDITNSAVVGYGNNSYTTAADTYQVPSVGEGTMTVTAATVYELQSRPETSRVVNAYGDGSTAWTNDEVFASIELWKVRSVTSAQKVGGVRVGGDYALVRDVKSDGTDGGTATTGSWETRDLNEETHDEGGNVAVGSNQVTVQPGSYLCRWTVPQRQCGKGQSRLYDVTNTAAVEAGQTIKLKDTAGNCGTTRGYSLLTVTAATVYEIQHRVQLTQATTGHGIANNFASEEVYTQFELIRIPPQGQRVGGLGPAGDPILVRSVLSSGTEGGSSSSGAWRTRTLNEITHDPAGHASLGSNQVTLAAGSYVVDWICESYVSQDWQSRLYDITNSAVLLLGQSGIAASSGSDTSRTPGFCYLVLTASTVIELQSRVESSQANNGFGLALSVASEIHVALNLRKVA